MTLPSVAAVLDEARGVGVSPLDARLLLAHLLGCSRTHLTAHDDRLLTAEELEAWRIQVTRRVDGHPVAYLLGEKEFYGLVFEVSPDVLVPRPETELLVDWAISLLSARPGQPSLLDLGTGSGAIAVAVMAQCPNARVSASDASSAALALARRNAERLGARIHFVEGSWWVPFHGQRFEVVVANPPYIALDDPHLPALRHEPTLALSPGGDGLGALREIVAGAPAHLAPGGWLVVEHGYDQAGSVAALLERAGLTDIECRHDLAGQPRATGARWV